MAEGAGFNPDVLDALSQIGIDIDAVKAGIVAAVKDEVTRELQGFLTDKLDQIQGSLLGAMREAREDTERLVAAQVQNAVNPIREMAEEARKQREEWEAKIAQAVAQGDNSGKGRGVSLGVLAEAIDALNRLSSRQSITETLKQVAEWRQALMAFEQPGPSPDVLGRLLGGAFIEGIKTGRQARQAMPPLGDRGSAGSSELRPTAGRGPGPTSRSLEDLVRDL